MSYRFNIDPKSLKSARFISRLQRAIQAELAKSGLTQQQVAERLGLNRSVVNRRLRGSSNLTARSIAEFAYAFDKDVVVRFVDRPDVSGSNHRTAHMEIRDDKVKGEQDLIRGIIDEAPQDGVTKIERAMAMFMEADTFLRSQGIVVKQPIPGVTGTA